MKCPECGNKLTSSTKFCPECGKEIETSLSEEQKRYLKRKKTGHQVGAVVGGLSGGVLVILGMIFLVIGILLSLTIILAIIGVPLIIIGIMFLIMGIAGTHGASKSARRVEEIEDRLHGIKK